jgi:hypothetical protein
MERGIFETNAEKLRQLHKTIEATYRDRQVDEKHYQVWAEACQCFHNSFDRLAFPGGLEQEMDLLKRGDAQAVEMAVRFLEANPWFFRSGYIKEQLLRELRKVSLSEDQRDRLREVIMNRINKGSGREFRRYCRLAKDLMNPKFIAQVGEAMMSDDANISRRAAWVLGSFGIAARDPTSASSGRS